MGSPLIHMINYSQVLSQHRAVAYPNIDSCSLGYAISVRFQYIHLQIKTVLNI